jgi:hypothetical protein
VNKPFACPNNSLSMMLSSTPPQLTGTTFPVRRALCACSARDDLFACSAFACDQDRTVGVGQLGDGLQDLLHPRARGHTPVIISDRMLYLSRHRGAFSGAPNGRQQSIAIERLR